MGLILIASGLWVYSTIEDRPKVEHAFWDIPLDATKSDVRFIKGEPSEKDDDMWRYFTRHENGNWATAYYVQRKIQGRARGVGPLQSRC